MDRNEIVLSVGDTIVVGRQLLTVHKATEQGVEFLIELLPEEVFPESETEGETSGPVSSGPFATEDEPHWSSYPSWSSNPSWSNYSLCSNDMDQYSESFEQSDVNLSNSDSVSNRRMNRPR